MTLTQYAWTINTESALEIPDDTRQNKNSFSLYGHLKGIQQNLQTLIELIRKELSFS